MLPSLLLSDPTAASCARNAPEASAETSSMSTRPAAHEDLCRLCSRALTECMYPLKAPGIDRSRAEGTHLLRGLRVGGRRLSLPQAPSSSVPSPPSVDWHLLVLSAPTRQCCSQAARANELFPPLPPLPLPLLPSLFISDDAASIGAHPRPRQWRPHYQGGVGSPWLWPVRNPAVRCASSLSTPPSPRSLLALPIQTSADL